jgi:hypothetical protein
VAKKIMQRSKNRYYNRGTAGKVITSARAKPNMSTLSAESNVINLHDAE